MRQGGARAWQQAWPVQQRAGQCIDRQRGVPAAMQVATRLTLQQPGRRCRVIVHRGDSLWSEGASVAVYMVDCGPGDVALPARL